MNSLSKIFRILPIALLTALSLSAASAQSSEKKSVVKIRGTVVAEYNSLIPCGWHVCGMSLIVKLDKPEPYKYVVVNVTYMDQHRLPQRGRPVDLAKGAKRWKFTAVSSDAEMQPLQQYWKIHNENGEDVSQEVKSPAWSLLEGATDEDLPYGKPIPNFEVGVGKYKRID